MGCSNETKRESIIKFSSGTSSFISGSNKKIKGERCWRNCRKKYLRSAQNFIGPVPGRESPPILLLQRNRSPLWDCSSSHNPLHRSDSQQTNPGAWIFGSNNTDIEKIAQSKNWSFYWFCKAFGFDRIFIRSMPNFLLI